MYNVISPSCIWSSAERTDSAADYVDRGPAVTHACTVQQRRSVCPRPPLSELALRSPAACCASPHRYTTSDGLTSGPSRPSLMGLARMSRVTILFKRISIIFIPVVLKIWVHFFVLLVNWLHWFSFKTKKTKTKDWYKKQKSYIYLACQRLKYKNVRISCCVS